MKWGNALFDPVKKDTKVIATYWKCLVYSIHQNQRFLPFSILSFLQGCHENERNQNNTSQNQESIYSCPPYQSNPQR